jgi:RimJ/RimL family protein N-acetyltransferase
MHVRNPGIVTEDQQAQWWAWLTKDSDKVRMFSVELYDHMWILIGCVGLTTIDWQNRRAELSVYTVPPKYEVAAAGLILRHAFNDLGLHKIEAETLTDRRFTLCGDLGFSCEGSRRHAYWRAGEFINATRWGLLADDYTPTELEAL